MPQRIIIIGATSGIGKELALLYLVNNNLVGVTGRRQTLLDELQNAYPRQVQTACFDVTDPQNIAHLEVLIEKLGGLDLLIYNSGFGEPSETLDVDNEKETTLVNVNGFVAIAAYAFNYFAQKGSGQIAVTSSIAALRGNSWTPAYSASKAYVSNYAEGLNMKAWKMKKDIVVTDIKPGFIATKMAKGNKRFWVASPQKAARQIKNAVDKKKRRAYITKRWWLIAQAVKILPYFLLRRLL